jgi:hypothetical protein
VGAGTGEIGYELLARGLSYLALDESPEMLSVFREKARASGLAPEVSVGNAEERWPVADGSMRLVFGSRSFHWLSPEHVVHESVRVASSAGCAVLIGRVERGDDNPRARLRRKMRELLRQAGHAGRSGRESTRAIVERLVSTGAEPIAPSVAARWTARTTPHAVLEAWRDKSGLGGADVPNAVKTSVLEQTRDWAVKTFGNIDLPIESEECYTLDGAMLPASGSPTR